MDKIPYKKCEFCEATISWWSAKNGRKVSHKNYAIRRFCNRSCSAKKVNKSRLLGTKMSKETRLKMSNSHRGEKSYLWRGGITPINKQIRHTLEYRLWREAVFKRDDYTCQECASRGVTLNADHIKQFAYYPELRFLLSNGRTLCIDCHKKTETYLSKGVKPKEKCNA